MRVRPVGLSALAAAILLVAVPCSLAGEREGAVTGVMQIDISGVLEDLRLVRESSAKMADDMRTLREQVVALSEQVAALHKAVADMSTALTTGLAAVAPPPRWEYRVLRTTSETALNALGAEGWEAVAGYQDVLVLRKPVRPQAPEPRR